MNEDRFGWWLTVSMLVVLVLITLLLEVGVPR